MKSPTLIALLMFIPAIALWSQSSQSSLDRNKVITELPNGHYEIKAYSKDSLPLYKGILTSIDPEVREGKFYFLDNKSRVKAIGQYRNDFPVGMWTYYDSSMNVVNLLDYDRVWNYLEHEAHNFSVDTLAIAKLKKKDKLTMNADGTFFDVGVMPTFRHGDPGDTFMAYLTKNAQHPAYADAIDYEGVVDLDFTIDSEGFIRNPVVTKGSLPDLNIEAMRVLIESPAWEPGLQRKIPVNVRISCQVEFVDDHSPKRYYIVEEMPQFNKQDPAKSFRYHIATNLRYPNEAAEAGISGRVLVQFTVMSDGSVDEIVIVRGVHPLLDKEAKRVISVSPRWTPGKQRGKNTAVIYTYPINFVLD